jgi:hypothetical protein
MRTHGTLRIDFNQAMIRGRQAPLASAGPDFEGATSDINFGK